MSFNPQEVFSSVQSFLSSGYVLLAIIAMLGVGIAKKLLSILIAGVVIGVIWFLAQDQIMAAWTELLGIAHNIPLG